jgi:TatD DNase family protein
VEKPTLDAHAHIAADHPSQDLQGSGFMLGMTLSLNEAERVAGRQEAYIVWGAGCHPRMTRAQEAFDARRFSDLAERSAIVGEIGLDTGSRVPMELQLRNLRQALEVLAKVPRLVSIHSYQATGLILQELRQRPIAVPVLHWWTGTADETSEAVELGCYFSIHYQVARQSKFRTRVPPERILVESDHSYADPPAAIPCRFQWVEYLVAQQLRLTVEQVRDLTWRNLARIVRETNTWDLWPSTFLAAWAEIGVSKGDS